LCIKPGTAISIPKITIPAQIISFLLINFYNILFFEVEVEVEVESVATIFFEWFN